MGIYGSHSRVFNSGRCLRGVGTVLQVDAVSNLNLVRRDWRNTTVSGSFGVKYCLENCKFKFSAETFYECRVRENVRNFLPDTFDI